MQLGHGGGVGTQGGDLAHHVHPLSSLLIGLDRPQFVTISPKALAGDPQPAQVEQLQRGPHLLRGGARLGQATALVGESAHELGVDTAGGVPG